MSRILFVLLSACLLHCCAQACDNIIKNMTTLDKDKMEDFYKCKAAESLNLKRSRINHMNGNNNIKSDRLLSRPFSREDGAFMKHVATLWRLHVSSGDAAASRKMYFKRYALYNIYGYILLRLTGWTLSSMLITFFKNIIMTFSYMLTKIIFDKIIVVCISEHHDGEILLYRRTCRVPRIGYNICVFWATLLYITSMLSVTYYITF